MSLNSQMLTNRLALLRINGSEMLAGTRVNLILVKLRFALFSINV